MSPVEATLAAALAKARESCGTEGLLALVHAPTAFRFGRVGQDGITIFDGTSEQSLALETVYEARMFGPAAEVHWRRSGISGRLALKEKTDDEIPLAALFWGKAKENVALSSGSWTLMASPRTPGFWVPFAGGRNERLKLTGMEAVGTGQDGNAHVVAERLTGLAVAD